MIAVTAAATFYLSRSLLPPPVAKTSVAKAPKIEITPTQTPQIAIRRSPALTPTPTPTPLLISPTPKVSRSPVAPTLPQNSALLPEILSPIITTKINPEANLSTPPAVSEPPEQITEPILLTEVKCSTTSADVNNQSFVESLENLTIGKETVTAIAELASQNFHNPTNSQLKADVPAGVDCLLNPRDTTHQFNTLKLAFGISDTNKYLSNASAGTKVRLTVYLDRKNIGSKEVTKGEIKTWGVNIADVQNVGLEAECIKSSNISNICPALVFTQVDLN